MHLVFLPPLCFVSSVWVFANRRELCRGALKVKCWRFQEISLFEPNPTRFRFEYVAVFTDGAQWHICCWFGAIWFLQKNDCNKRPRVNPHPFLERGSAVAFSCLNPDPGCSVYLCFANIEPIIASLARSVSPLEFIGMSKVSSSRLHHQFYNDYAPFWGVMTVSFCCCPNY